MNISWHHSHQIEQSRVSQRQMVGFQWVASLNLYTFNAFLQQHLLSLNHLFSFYWMYEHCLIIKNYSSLFSISGFSFNPRQLF